MNNPLRTVEDYELFLYTLPQRFPIIQHSTVRLIRRGATLARVEGEILFAPDIRLIVRERLVYSRLPALIDWYGYEIWREDQKLYWYDSQPHPDDPALQENHPHHKHIPPDIKHHRVPAPNMSFTSPNLQALIEEVQDLITSSGQLASD